MSQSPSPEEAVPVDWRELEPDTLRRVLEDLVTRGEPDETALDRRCHQLQRALEEGRAQLFFDPHQETVFCASEPGRTGRLET